MPSLSLMRRANQLHSEYLSSLNSRACQTVCTLWIEAGSPFCLIHPSLPMCFYFSSPTPPFFLLLSSPPPSPLLYPPLPPLLPSSLALSISPHAYSFPKQIKNMSTCSLYSLNRDRISVFYFHPMISAYYPSPSSLSLSISSGFQFSVPCESLSRTCNMQFALFRLCLSPYISSRTPFSSSSPVFFISSRFQEYVDIQFVLFGLWQQHSPHVSLLVSPSSSPSPLTLSISPRFRLSVVPFEFLSIAC